MTVALHATTTDTVSLRDVSHVFAMADGVEGRAEPFLTSRDNLPVESDRMAGLLAVGWW